MSEKKRFIALCILLAASVVLLVIIRNEVGQNFSDQF